jgi:chromosome segregation ATPase
MANDKNTVNELVADNDATTSELEALADTCGYIGQQENRLDKPSIVELKTRLRDLDNGELEVQRQAGRLACAEAEIRKMRVQIERTEAYADDIRRQLQERLFLANEVEDSKEHLQINLRQAIRRIGELESDLTATQSTSERLTVQLASIRDAHAEEIRVVRFELGEAQETLTQHELMAGQLASDLVDTRGFRDQLEASLMHTEKESQSRIEDLERENRRLHDELEHQEEQLESKSEAINCLLAEMTKKPRQTDTIGEIEEVIHQIDDRVSERIEDHTRRARGRVSRVLIGAVDDQELRFPLFKDRLTIGRAEQNDIQLKASCVSRRHAVIVSDQDSTRVVDWGSRNGVFVNTKRVTEHFLNNGDSVSIGTAKFRYEERPKRNA